MIHLFKHKDGKFDIALVVKGKFIVGSNQHYNRKSTAINAARSLINESNIEVNKKGDVKAFWFYLQDDSLNIPRILIIHVWDKKFIQTSEVKPSKQYVPNKK